MMVWTVKTTDLASTLSNMFIMCIFTYIISTLGYATAPAKTRSSLVFDFSMSPLQDVCYLAHLQPTLHAPCIPPHDPSPWELISFRMSWRTSRRWMSAGLRGLVGLNFSDAPQCLWGGFGLRCGGTLAVDVHTGECVNIPVCVDMYLTDLLHVPWLFSWVECVIHGGVR